jgi:hypothetical protein
MARATEVIIHRISLGPPGMQLGDDEIEVHAEALDDGRAFPEPGFWPAGEFQDDEIGSHMEEGELLFALPTVHHARRRQRRTTRH